MAQYYVSPSGNSSNTGAFGSPWDLQTALNQSGASAALAGDDIVNIFAGTYQVPAANQFSVLARGTSGHRITYRAYRASAYAIDRVRINAGGGSIAAFYAYDTSSNNTSPFTMGTTGTPTAAAAGYLDFKDLEFYDGTSGANGAMTGVWFHGARSIRLINCIFHDLKNPIYLDVDPTVTSTNAGNALDCEFRGCVIYYAGNVDGQNHGIYFAGNNQSTRKALDCISMFATGYPVQVYGHSNAGGMLGITLDGIIAAGGGMFNGGTPSLNQEMIISADTIEGATPGNAATNCFTYNPSTRSGDKQIFSKIWTTVQGCYFCGRTAFIDGTFHQTVGGAGGLANTFNFGTCYATDYGEWSTFGCDHSSTVSATFPNNTFFPSGTPSDKIVVRPNLDEVGRGHVAIYNWSLSATQAVDLSTILAVNDLYEVRYATNYYGTAVLTGTYAGGTVNFPMSGLTNATPLGGVSTPALIGGAGNTEFAAFVVRKTGTSPPITITPTTLPNCTRNVAYSQQMTAAGGTGPYTYAVTSGALPTGLTINSTGLISGTTSVAINTFTFTVTATDSLVHTGSINLSLQVVDVAGAGITIKLSGGTSTIKITSTGKLSIGS